MYVIAVMRFIVVALIWGCVLLLMARFLLAEMNATTGIACWLAAIAIAAAELLFRKKTTRDLL